MIRLLVVNVVGIVAVWLLWVTLRSGRPEGWSPEWWRYAALCAPGVAGARFLLREKASRR